jgi:hypothetical protein
MTKQSTQPATTIIQAMRSQRAFRPFFGPLASKQKRESWHSWEVFLAAVYGLPIAPGPDLELFRKCTGLEAPPTEQVREIFCVSGRRSGKSRIAALLAVWQGAFRDWRRVLGPGERGKAIVVAVDRAQAQVIKNYVTGLLNGTPALRALVKAEARDRIELKTGVDIEIMTADFRSIRGRTIVFAAMEEVAFWAPNERSSSPAREIYRALRPSLATVPGGLIVGISTAYARQGLLWEQVQKHHGKPGSTLVWVSDSRTMNPTLSQTLIDEEIEADPAAARAEWLSVFRDDIESFIGIELLKSAIVPGRTTDIPLARGAQPVGFIDPSGGRQDSYTAAVASVLPGGRIVINGIREARPPFSPETVTAEFAEFFKAYGVTEVVSDRFGGAWVEEAWSKGQIGLRVADQTASEYYLNFLALLSSGRVELPENARLQAQLLQLERRVRPGGKDQVTHPPGLHDDLANAVAGAAVTASAAEAAGNYGFVGELPDVRPSLFPEAEARYGPTKEGWRDWIENSRKIH